MAARAGGDGDQPVGALFDRLAREAIVDDVVERDAAPVMHRLVELLARAERGDGDRHLPFLAGRDVGLEPVVRAVDDLVDREGRRDRIACPVGKVDWVSAGPPPPVSTGINPSSPVSTALRAKRSSMTSWGVMPPQLCTAWLSSSRAPSEGMVIGTFHFSQVAMSASSRSFERWTIWLTAKGAESRSGLSRSQAASSSVMRWSHSSSSGCGRALSAGKLPKIGRAHV